MSQAPLMLSVSGLRGWIGQTLTPPVASRYAGVFGQWLWQQRRASGRDGAPVVVVGRDSRPSGPMIEHAAVAGLLGVGCRVVTLGIATTPGVAIMTEHLNADGGMVITASHNPINWNGIKALRHDGVAPPPEQAGAIIEAFRADRQTWVGVEALGTAIEDGTATRVHLDRILPHVDVAGIRRRRPKVVLDSVCGAGGPSTAQLLSELGVELVHLHGEPTGRFPHTPEPTRDNLTGLSDAVREHGADLGLAQDPDADRLALVDEQGRYIGEEYTLALATMHVLESRGERGGAVVANLSTSRMIDDVAGRHGCRVVRTAVGEANVAAAMRRENAVIGGEGNGGVIWPRVVHVRDSLGGAALILDMLARSGQALSAAVARIPAYAIIKDKVDVQPSVLPTMAERLRGRFTQQRIDTQDGVRIDWPDRWVHVRPSNTEPIIRLIAEAREETSAREMIAQVRETLGL